MSWGSSRLLARIHCKKLKQWAALQPDIMVCEPTELIGTGQTSDVSYMEETNRPSVPSTKKSKILQAAGISTADDVAKALQIRSRRNGWHQWYRLRARSAERFDRNDQKSC